MKSIFFCLFFLFTAFQLISCKATRLTLPPNPPTIQVALTPSQTNLYSTLADCAAAAGPLSLFYREAQSGGALESGDDILILLESEILPLGRVYMISQEKIVLIVNKENPISEISLDDLRGIYAGFTRDWGDIQSSGNKASISLWGYPEKDEVRNVFIRDLLTDQVEPPHLYLAPSPAAMLEVVSSDRNAIGYIPGAWLDESVKSIPIIDVEEGMFETAILAVTPVEPGPELSPLIACVSDTLNK